MQDKHPLRFFRHHPPARPRWRYLGLGTVVGQKYDVAANTELTMQNGSTGDAGDPYTGLDRFGRLVETIWESGSNELVHSRYGRNRVGGVVCRRDEKAHSLSPEVKTQDNYYRYDGLQQVTRHDRGDLVPSSSGPGYTGIDPDTRQQQEIFTFDETGNWMTDYNAASSLSQSRTQNAANEITALTQEPSAVQPSYDPAGNMRTVPQSGDWEQGYDLQWDAWNRLTEIKHGVTIITHYAYDALSRRITTSTDSEDHHYYYDNQWRVIEERLTIDSTTTISRQYVWSPFDRWNLIRRKRTTSSSLDETRYLLKDYLDPVALVNIVDSAAVVDERYSYDAFGSVNIMNEDFEPRTSSVCDWNFLFHAEFKDLDTGLYNYGYRYYHPELGRWISRDPIGERGGLNLYSYLSNRITRMRDLLGLLAPPPVMPPPNVIPVIPGFNEFLKQLALEGEALLSATGEGIAVGAEVSVAAVAAVFFLSTSTASNSAEAEFEYETKWGPKPDFSPETKPQVQPKSSETKTRPKDPPRRMPTTCVYTRFGNPFLNPVTGLGLEHGGTDSCNCVYNCTDGEIVYIQKSHAGECPYAIPRIRVAKILLLLHPGSTSQS